MTTNSSQKVSIVMPTYNGERYIKEAISSCLEQTYKNTELIIVDDGSTDNTSSIVSEVNDSKIRYVKLDKNMGQANALNVGFKITEGEYLTWMGDDDLYKPKAIKKMSQILEANKDVDFVYANYYMIDRNGDIIRMVNVEESINLRERNCIGLCFLYRRMVYERIGDYNPDFWLTEDYEYWVRVYKSGFKMLSLPEFLFCHRIHSESKTGRYALKTKENQVIQQAIQIRKKYFKGYCLKKFLVSRFNILKGKFIWRKQWLKEKHPLIAKPFILLKNELIKIK